MGIPRVLIYGVFIDGAKNKTKIIGHHVFEMSVTRQSFLVYRTVIYKQYHTQSGCCTEYQDGCENLQPRTYGQTTAVLIFSKTALLLAQHWILEVK